MSKTRVVYVGTPLALCGSTMVMLDILNHLDRSKYEPHLILGPGSGMDAAHLLRDDVTIHDARNLRTWWSRRFVQRYRFTRYLANKVKTANADVFIVDHRRYNYLFSEFTEKYGIRVINRIGTIVSWRLEKANRQSEKETARRLLPNSDAIVVPSQLAKTDLVESFGVAEDKITVVHNALDLHKLRKGGLENTHVCTDRKILLSVGVLEYGKSPMFLLEAFKELCVRRSDIELWFVGDGDQRGQLERYVEANDLEGRVRFWGFQKNPYKFFKRADVFVHSSQMDGFGIVLMEAAYFNLPIVYADTLVGAKELLQKHNIGYPYDISSKENLLGNVEMALEQPKKEYFELLRADISIDNFIKQVAEVIDEVVA